MNVPAFSLTVFLGQTPESLTPLLIDLAFRSTALLLAAALCALALWRASAATRHFVWALAIVAILLLPVLSGILPGWRVLPTRTSDARPAAAPAQIAASATASPSIHPAAPARPDPAPLAPEPPSLPVTTRLITAGISPDATSALPVAAASTWRNWVSFIWAAGAGLLFLRLFAAQLLLCRAFGRCRELRPGAREADDKILRAFAAVRSQFGVHHGITLLIDEKRSVPVVWGIFRLRLMLPAEARLWDEQQLRSVLAHELGHIRRGDLRMQWLTEIARALYWFNPLVWVAAHRLYAERERACDDLVLASGVLPSAYAGHLLHVASRLSSSRWTHAGGLSMARKSSLEHRLQAVISNRQNRSEVSRAVSRIGLTLLIALVVPIAMLQAAEEKKEVAASTTEHALTARSVTSVTTAEDSAELSVVEGRGEIAFVVGEGPQTRVLLHAFGSSPHPLIFRVTADDRQGKWWDQARMIRKGEGEALFPELPADWLPRGRIGFLPAPEKRADGTIVFAQIDGASGKVPLGVRTPTASETSLAASRELPITTPESEILFDCRIHALAAGAPDKTVVLPVMAAADLTGSPRTALYFPYITLRPGVPSHYNRMASRAEEVNVLATMGGNGIQVDGTILVRLVDGNFASAKEAKDATEKFIEGGLREPGRKLQAKFSTALGGNDSLVIPIPSEGLFPETLVASITARSRRISRVRWQLPGMRGPIQLDGWVFTWPRAEHEWFAKTFDYDGLPSMISRSLKQRGEPSPNSITSEAVGTLNSREVERLLAAFRQHATVRAARVEPFSAKQSVSGWLKNEDRTHFSADGEGASVHPTTDGRTVSLNLRWDKPVLRHMSASDPYGLYSGTSICVLLPGPVDPEMVRMLVLRCVDPDAAETK